MPRLLPAFLATFALFGAAQASTLDFSGGSFDEPTESFVFPNVAPGVVLFIEPINGTDLGSNNPANNGSVGGTGDSSGGRINIGIENPANSVDLRFSFLDDAFLTDPQDRTPVVLDGLEVGFYDVDFVRREVVTLITPAAVTTTADTDLLLTQSNGEVSIIGSETGNVPNPSDFANLTVAQQDAAVDLFYGNRSFFDLRLFVDATNGTGRNFFIGNVTFTEPTTTLPPVPVPAAGLLLASALCLLGLRRRLKG